MKGTYSPLFLYLKMDKLLINQVIEEALEVDESLFLIEFEVFPDNKISVIVDGDNGVPLNQCIRISRAIEERLDREEEDFSLEVSSPDITKPLVQVRQYKKNIGRTLKVKANDREIKGVLEEVLEDQIVLKWKTREPKPIGKGKVTVEKTESILFTDIVEAKVEIIFN